MGITPLNTRIIPAYLGQILFVFSVAMNIIRWFCHNVLTLQMKIITFSRCVIFGKTIKRTISMSNEVSLFLLWSSRIYWIYLLVSTFQSSLLVNNHTSSSSIPAFINYDNTNSMELVRRISLVLEILTISLQKLNAFHPVYIILGEISRATDHLTNTSPPGVTLLAWYM